MRTPSSRKINSVFTQHTFRTGYRIRNTNNIFYCHGYRIRLRGENFDAKNKVFFSK